MNIEFSGDNGINCIKNDPDFIGYLLRIDFMS